MKCINPQTQGSSTNPRQNKHKENQTTIHRNQIAEKQRERDCKVARGGKQNRCYVQRNKNLQLFRRREGGEAGEMR